jgi:hypothetical protein
VDRDCVENHQARGDLERDWHPMIGGRVRGRTKEDIGGEKEHESRACLVGDGLSLECRRPACGCARVRGVVLGKMSGGGSTGGKTNEGVEAGDASDGGRRSCERGLYGSRRPRVWREEACGGRCVRRSLGIETGGHGEITSVVETTNKTTGSAGVRVGETLKNIDLLN